MAVKSVNWRKIRSPSWVQTILLTVALEFFFLVGALLSGIVFKADTKMLLHNMLEHAGGKGESYPLDSENI